MYNCAIVTHVQETGVSRAKVDKGKSACVCAPGMIRLALDEARKRSGCSRAFEPRDGSSLPSKTAKPHTTFSRKSTTTQSEVRSLSFIVFVRVSSKDSRMLTIIVHFSSFIITFLDAVVRLHSTPTFDNTS